MSSPSLARRVDNRHLDNLPDKDHSDFEADVERYHLTLRGKKLTVALAFVAGTGFTLFGCCLYLLQIAILRLTM